MKKNLIASTIALALISAPAISFGVCSYSVNGYPEKCRLPSGDAWCESNGDGGGYAFLSSCVKQYGRIKSSGEQLKWMPYAHLNGAIKNVIKKDLTQWDETSKIKVAFAKLNKSSTGKYDSVFVNNLNGAWCGSGGCKLEIFTMKNGVYDLVGSWVAGSYLGVDVVLTGGETNGMKNIAIESSPEKGFVNGKYH